MHNYLVRRLNRIKENIKDKFQSRYILYEGTGFIGKGVVGLSI